MKKFILIGGPSRSATNSVSMFLHLHDDVVIFGNGSGVHPVNEGMDFFGELLKVAYKGLQTPTIKNQDIRLQVITKNELLRDDIASMKDKPVFGLRWDYAETIFPMLLGIMAKERRELKMVVTLRNIFDVFKSQHHHNFIVLDIDNDPVIAFCRRVENSFIQLQYLKKKMSEKILFVDVTTPQARSEYIDILSFVGIEASDSQNDWIRDLPVTNDTIWEGIKDPVEHDFSALEEMRLELLSMEEK
jgi:hypothetical protein